jgi:hypothetical protein
MRLLTSQSYYDTMFGAEELVWAVVSYYNAYQKLELDILNFIRALVMYAPNCDARSDRQPKKEWWR